MPTDDPVEGTSHCLGCGRCVRACPTGALRGDGSVDARRCISYLTIESHDDIPADIPTGNTLYGCDVCRRACPLVCCKTDIGQGRQLEHSKNLENSEHSSVSTSGKFAETMTVLPEFTPDSRLLSMTVADWRALDDEGYAALTAHSAMRRVSLDKLRSTLRRFPKG